METVATQCEVGMVVTTSKDRLLKSAFRNKALEVVFCFGYTYTKISLVSLQ